MVSDTIPRLLRATGPGVPRYRYWNAATRTWGRFDTATRYAHPDDAVAPTPPGGAAVEWVEDLPVDLDGHPFVEAGTLGPWRVTSCCAGWVGVDDGPLYCKSCYETVGLEVDTPARLDGNWRPGNGPVRIELPPR